MRAAVALLLATLGCEQVEPRPASSEPAPIETREPVESEPVESEPVESEPVESEPVESEPPCELVDPPPNMIDLAKAIPDAIIVAGYQRLDNFTGAPLPGYEAPGAWLEQAAAHALVEAADALARDGLRLIIYDGYRPRSASEAMVAWAEANHRQELLDDGWVARRSAHNRGRAVDLGLADHHGTALEMGSAWDQFDRTSHVRGVDGEPLERRLKLRAAMVEVGFVPYEREWWHFGYRSDTVAPVLDQPYACR